MLPFRGGLSIAVSGSVVRNLTPRAGLEPATLRLTGDAGVVSRWFFVDLPTLTTCCYLVSAANCSRSLDPRPTHFSFKPLVPRSQEQSVSASPPVQVAHQHRCCDARTVESTS